MRDHRSAGTERSTGLAKGIRERGSSNRESDRGVAFILWERLLPQVGNLRGARATRTVFEPLVTLVRIEHAALHGTVPPWMPPYVAERMSLAELGCVVLAEGDMRLRLGGLRTPEALRAPEGGYSCAVANSTFRVPVQ